MTTARDLITDALFACGAYGQGEDLDAADATLGLRRLQRMLDSWSNDNLSVYATTDATVACVAGTASYATSVWTPTTRPVAIQNAYLRSGDIDYALSEIAEPEYDAIPDKSTQGLPCKFFYKPSATAGTVFLWPVPDTTYTLHMVVKAPLASALTLDTVFALPPGYEAAIEDNLAVELAPRFGISVTPELMRAAMNSRNALVVANFVPRVMNTGLPGRGRYLIENGPF